MPVTGALAVLLPLSVLLSLGIGPVHVAFAGIVEQLCGLHRMDATTGTIIFSLRLPRSLAAGCVGAALSVAGLLFQGLFRNPLADPYIIGSSSGSVLGAALAIFWFPSVTFLGFGSTALFAFAGATVTVLLVYLLAQTRQSSSNTLLLAGFALGTMLTSVSYLLESLHDNNSAGLLAFAAWLRGAVTTPLWPQLAVVAAMLFCGLVVAWMLMHRLNAMAMGDAYAAQLGISLEQTRLCIIVAGAMLTAAAVSLSGLIGFVGLIVPHVLRMLLGPDHRTLLPACALGGAVFVMLADTIARTLLSPAELPVGILMALLGGPFFLFLLRRRPEVYTA